MSAKKVLIVEDEEILHVYLVKLLETEGFICTSVTSIQELEGVLADKAFSCDLVVLDRLLNGRDAGTKISQIKLQISGVKILVVSAINTPSEKASILDLGADDYVAKPFDGEELIARIRALLRRNLSVFRFSNILLNLEERKIFVGESEIHLATKEFLFLKTLLQEPGKIFSKDYLYEKVWEMNPEVESNALETTVTKLRRRLEEAKSLAQIRNSRNVGYWIEE